jgi:large subunit ribosomal protein L5
MAEAQAQPRLREKYAKEVVPALMKRFGYDNPMQVPGLVKIVLNMGLGEAVANPKLIEAAVTELTAIAGQKPVVTRARKSIANFKLREGMPIGIMVTLRKERMWEFYDRLVTLSLPRVRDFRGTSPRAFDGAGNYTLGLKEQIVFPEIDFDKVDKIKGMNVTVVTTAKTNEEAKELLGGLGMPSGADVDGTRDQWAKLNRPASFPPEEELLLRLVSATSRLIRLFPVQDLHEAVALKGSCPA